MGEMMLYWSSIYLIWSENLAYMKGKKNPSTDQHSGLTWKVLKLGQEVFIPQKKNRL